MPFAYVHVQGVQIPPTCLNHPHLVTCNWLWGDGLVGMIYLTGRGCLSMGGRCGRETLANDGRLSGRRSVGGVTLHDYKVGSIQSLCTNCAQELDPIQVPQSVVSPACEWDNPIELDHEGETCVYWALCFQLSMTMITGARVQTFSHACQIMILSG